MAARGGVCAVICQRLGKGGEIPGEVLSLAVVVGEGQAQFAAFGERRIERVGLVIGEITGATAQTPPPG